MPKAKRTYHEAIIQKLFPKRMWGKEFEPTSNTRNEAMFKEAYNFARWIFLVERNITIMDKWIDKFMRDNVAFMQSTLPRVYESTEAGEANAIEWETTQVGQGANMEQLAHAPAELQMKMSSDVVQPLRNWLVKFQDIKQEMVKLESLRLEVDSRRRTVRNMSTKLNRSQTNYYSKENREETEGAKLEKQAAYVDHKTNKANSAISQYQELEQHIYQELVGLVNDSVYLKSCMETAMLISLDCFRTAADAFGDVPTLLPENYVKVAEAKEVDAESRESFSQSD
eukprot:TRINITY_DN14515_c0_g1_i1.p1 TRINITY_DN14515_c0_g1~~TRINITY_DN14515_c0_g1_i1.p1  ORF type:complete len:322 (-),score=24.56 TRINITY_DN14515_c0_g1_i1:410-1258(-)